MRCSSLRSLVGLLFVLVAIRSAAAGERLDPAAARKSADGMLVWYDIKPLGVEGKGWTDTAADYDRLPAKAQGKVRDAVWGLSRNSAGMCVRFVTDATAIHAEWELTSPRLEMPHMPASGVSGLDLYVRTADGKWRWLANGRPAAQKSSVPLATGLPAGKREYLLYLPLYNGVSSVEVGIPSANALEKAPPRAADHSRPIVFYGTSITHGACASRPGMVHTAILGRWFERPVINLGFSGNGRMEPEVAALMAELDAAVYVIDCLPNIGAEEVRARTAPLVKTLRQAHPDTPILLVEDRNYPDSFLIESKRQRNETSQAALREVFGQLTADGVKGLHYLPGKDLIGDDGEGTVDSSHPTDLGFMRQAEAFRTVLGPILKQEAR
jgi:hypothetical protein